MVGVCQSNVKNLVRWIAAYRYRLAIAAMVLAGAPFLMPFSIGMIALATLRGDARDGVLVTGGAVVALSLLEPLMPGAFVLAMVTAIVFWLPAVGLATLMARWGSLSLCLQVLTLIGLATVCLFWLSVEDPQAWSLDLLQAYFLPLLQQANAPVESEVALAGMARFMIGSIAASWILTLAVGLIAGRWWQGMLSDDGLLGREFRGHRQGLAIGALAAIIFVAGGLAGYALLQNLVLVLVIMFMLQGLALAHWLVKQKGLKSGWLAGIYFALPIGAPWSVVILAAVGFMDNWMSLRSAQVAKT